MFHRHLQWGYVSASFLLQVLLSHEVKPQKILNIDGKLLR